MNETAQERFGISRKILVVDDELINRQILGKIIGEEYEVLFAENGKEALQLLDENRGVISLVLLDLLMPEMDGYMVMEEMKKDGELSQIPVIVLTSEKSAEVRSLRMGAVDFIPKPYDTREVIKARINRSVQLSENRSIINATQTDALTGLFNREYFYEYSNIIDHYNPDAAMDAVAVNINRFHLINDMNGRKYGNKVLKKLADAIQGLVKEQHGIACRVDSDSFFLYLPNSKTPEEMLEIMAEGLEGLLDKPKSRLRLGIYQNVDRSLEPDRRFDRALIACNTIRSNYMQQIAFYDEEMHKNEAFAERLINDIGRALEEKHFCVYYQPKFSIQGEQAMLSSAEALIRWKHPELGMIRPDHFIPLFEGNGLVQELDHFVWREAAAQIAAWKKQYDTVLPVSVNVSRIDLMEPDFVDRIQTIVQENGLENDQLLLEVTESAYTENSEQIIAVVVKLRELGFKVEMDDFGSGYSSLNMLSSLPIDALKLDRGFIKNIHNNEKDMKMVELMVDIAGFLSVPVIAEGVEKEEQYLLLKEAGCDLIQGYYFSKPLPPDEFEHLIQEKIAYLEEKETC